MENEVISDYQSSLVDLTCNSKPLINMLTMLAEENEQYASHIVEVIESHINQADEKKKLPSLYLIDSIVKNLPKTTYPSLFSHNIVSVFCGMFEKVDEKTRQCMFKVRQTWNEIFPNRKLYAVDVRVNLVDPAWPITAQPPVESSIHVNPKFLAAKKEEEILDDEDLIIHDTVTEEQEALMRQQLIAKQQELLKLQQQRLELELKETRAKLDQQKQLNSGKSQPSEDLPIDPVEIPNPPILPTSKSLTETSVPTVTSAPSRPTTRDPRLASRDPRSVRRDPRLKGKSVADSTPPQVSKSESSPAAVENSELTSVPTSMVVPTSLMAYPPPPLPNMMPPTVAGMMPPGMVPGYMPPVMNIQPQTNILPPAGGPGRSIVLPGMLPFPMPTARMGIPVPPPVVNINNQAIPSKEEDPKTDKHSHEKSNSKLSKSSSLQHLSQKSSTDHKSKDGKESFRSSRDMRADRKHSDKRDTNSTSAKNNRHSESKRSSVEKDRDQKDNKDGKDRKSSSSSSSSSSSRRESPRTSYSSSGSKEEKPKTRNDSKSESKSKKSDKDDIRHKRSSRDSDEDSRKSNRSDDSDDRRRESTRSTRGSKTRTRSRSPVKSKSPEPRKSKNKAKEKLDRGEKNEKKPSKEGSKKLSPSKKSKKVEKGVVEKTTEESEKVESVKVKEEPVDMDTDNREVPKIEEPEKVEEIKKEKVEETAVEPLQQDVPKVASQLEDMDVDDRQVPTQTPESLKRDLEDKKEESDVTEDGPSSSKKARLEEEPELSTAKVMDEDLSSLFGSEDQDYRSQRDGPVPPMKSPYHDKWMKFRENHPGDFKYELDLQKGRELAAQDVDHRRASSESDPLKDVDHRHEGFPQDTDLRSSTTRNTLDHDVQDYDNRPRPKPVHIPAALQLDHREEILEQIEQRRRSGDLSHDMHQELLHQLSRLDNVQRQQDRLGFTDNAQRHGSPIRDTDRRGRDSWQYRSPLKDPPNSRSYEGRPDFQRPSRYRDGPLKDFDDRHGSDRRRTPPLDHSGPLRDRNRDIDIRHGPEFGDRRRPPNHMDGPNRDYDSRLGPPRDFDRRREPLMDANRPPRDWQGPDGRQRSGPNRDHNRDWNYNENGGRGWQNQGHWNDEPGYRKDGPPGRYHDPRSRYRDERGPPDGPQGRNGPYNDRGPHMGPPGHRGPTHQHPFIKRQQSTDPRWRRIVGYRGPDENEEFVIDGRPFGIAVGQPARKIRAAGRTIEVFADPNERAIRLDGAIVYRFGDMVRDVNIGRVNVKIFYHGLPRSIWIDGIMRELRVDAPPKIINIKDKEHTMRIDGRDLMILIDNKEMGVVGGPPRYAFIDNSRCEFRFDPPPRKILIDGNMCELKLDRAIPCIVINNKKRGIRFDGPPREIIVDNINYLVPVDDCVKIRINNRPHYLALGGPAHEVILDGKWFEVKFGGPAKEISLGNRVIYVRLEGPPPEVKILDEIIEEPESVQMRYESGPPAMQDPRPNGPVQHMQPSGPGQQGPSVMVMGSSMDSQPLMQQGMMQPQPGQVMMNPLQQQQVVASQGQPGFGGVMQQNPMLPTQIQGLMPAVSSTMTTGFPSQAPVQQAPTNQLNVDSLLQRLMATGIIPGKVSSDKDTTETAETPKPPEISGKNVNKKTTAKDNFIKPVFKQVKIKDVPDLTELKTEKLKQFHEGVIQSLFSGIQCSACGQRFSAQQTERYREHLDWHFRQNRRDKDDAKVTKYRRWYYDVSDWITYEEIDESEDKGRSNVFEKMLAMASTANAPSITQETVVNAPEGSDIIHCPPATGEEKGDMCEICRDPFEQFWDEDQEEWHLRDAIRVENKTYHPICYEDEKEGSILEPTPTPIKAPLENPLAKQIQEEANPIILQIRQELGELPVSAIDMSKVKVNKTKLFVPEDDEEEPAAATEVKEEPVQGESEEEEESERDSVMAIIKSVVKTEPSSTLVKTEPGL
ncbi:pre-mRNA cleavage complex 2 protein Pcf11-like isoform X2 [Ylistrum balloti]|uniref:pre-mRNA cleavage complex 2 protein Pcf11-like isoform X2 n=1 Tax=Ylistrum balloti TaxID=509963 RepID=UPI0029059663|nr:pre-mRNA cleavage complex 2 protein Pcf11-like isoform X2 [Ylistrum balloti]